MPAVSIIIPDYNHGKYLRETILSALSQTFADFEILLVDDGSTDDSRQVVESIPDPRLRYIFQENKGLPGARNTGIYQASGKYLTFLDSDDWYLPEKLARQVGYLDSHPEVGALACGYIETDGAGRDQRTISSWLDRPDLSLAGLLRGSPILPDTVLLRREWLERAGYFDENIRYAEDWDLWLRMAAEGCQFAWLPEVLVRYRIHTSNMTRNARRMRDGNLQALDKLFGRRDLPAEITSLKAAAYAGVYIDAAARALGGQEVAEARLNILKAIEYDASLADGHPCRLVSMLISWMGNPIVGSGEAYINLLAQSLPSAIPAAQAQVRRAASNFWMEKVFQAYRSGDLQEVRQSLVPAIRYSPAWLANKGVVSILAHAYLPGWRGRTPG